MTRREPRPLTDPESRVAGADQMQPVVIHTQARAKRIFSVKLRVFTGVPKDWNPDNPATQEKDLWKTTDEVINNVRYGLRSNDVIEPGVFGWIAWYQGMPFLVIADCE